MASMHSQPDAGENPSVLAMNSFLMTLPFDIRNYTGKLLVSCRKSLSSTISTRVPIKKYVRCIHDLRDVFLGLPFAVRKSIKQTLLNGLNASLLSSDASFAIFTTCLCLLDLQSIRNVDRIDLEGEDICTVVSRLNTEILPEFCKAVISKRTNIPDLYSWSMSMLIFTYRATVEWLTSNGYNTINVLEFDPAALVHASLPAVMRQILKLQTKRRPFPIPPQPYTLLDVVFSCAISDNFGTMQKAHVIPKFAANVSPLEASEVVPSRKRPHSNQLQATGLSFTTSDNSISFCEDDLKHSLQGGPLKNCVAFLISLRKAFFGDSCSNKEHLNNLVSVALRHSTALLLRMKSEDVKSNSGSPSEDQTYKDYKLFYEQIVILLLQLWFRAAEQRLLLSILPQSYLCLAGLTRINYQAMSIAGFVQTLVWMSRFLTSYQSVFRSAILASPHWYLQLISDAVVAIIDRLETTETERLDQLRETMCACVISISRPFHALGIDDPSVRPEMSRAVKLLLETIVHRMATCQTPRNPTTLQQQPTGQNKIKHQAQAASTSHCPVLIGQIRDCLFTYLIQTIVTSIDPWALGQAKIGARPASTRVLLKQILADAGQVLDAGRGDIAVAGRRAQRLVEMPKVTAAVGGLKVTEKLAVSKRRRR